MSALATLQRQFLDALADERVSVPPGIEIYRGNMLAGREAALAATYPVVRRLVGPAFFGEAARRFAIDRFAASGDLNEYGSQFPSFIEAYGPAARVACLADVARLEWACHESFHAADTAPLDLARLAAVPAEAYGELRFSLAAPVRLVPSVHPVASIWEANQAHRDGVPDRTEGAQNVVVHRVDLALRVEALERFDWNFLTAMAQGATLEAAAREGQAEERLAKSLERWVAAGVIAGFALPTRAA